MIRKPSLSTTSDSESIFFSFLFRRFPVLEICRFKKVIGKQTLRFYVPSVTIWVERAIRPMLPSSIVCRCQNASQSRIGPSGRGSMLAKRHCRLWTGTLPRVNVILGTRSSSQDRCVLCVRSFARFRSLSATALSKMPYHRPDETKWE